MIKLIATDLDGTLLNDKKELSPDFFDILAQLKKQGISFCAASGRSHYTIEKIFVPHQDELFYISDNGTYITGKNIKSENHTLTHVQAQKSVEECIKIEGLQIIMCAKDKAYFVNTQKKYIDILSEYYINYEIVDDFHTVKENILKIAVFDPKGSEHHSYPKIKDKLEKGLTAVVSAKNWFDIMNEHANKGEALERLQKHLKIRKEETMAFGDFDNDIEMLKKSGYAFAMQNASEGVKKASNHIAEDNNSNGVIKAIREFALSS